MPPPSPLRLGILGLTDQLVHQRISREDYGKWKRTLEVDLQRHSGTTAPLQVGQHWGGMVGMWPFHSTFSGGGPWTVLGSFSTARPA